MEQLHGFPEWVVAVIEHWHGWLSGGILAFVLEIGEKLWEWKPKKRVLAIIIGIGLLWSVFAAWRDEHRNTEIVIGEKATAWSQYNQCDKERAIQTTLAAGAAANLAYQQSRNDGQQDLFNKCMLALGATNKPEPARVRVKTVGFPVSNKSPAGKDLALLVSIAEVNKNVSPLRGNFKCQIPFTPLAIRLPVASMFSAPQVVSDREVRVNYLATPWEKDTPLVLTSWVDAQLAKSGISNVCSFKLD